MIDSILRTRLEMLKSSFIQVGQALNAMEERRKELREMASLLGGAQGGEEDEDCEEEGADGGGAVGKPPNLRSIDEAVRKASEGIEISLAKMANLKAVARDSAQNEELQKALHGSAAAAKRVIELLEDVRGRLRRIQRRSMRLPTDALRGKFQVDLINAADDWVEVLNQIDDELVKPAERQIRDGNQPAADALLREAWKRFGQEVYTMGVRMFQEYVDFLGGVALRDTGFDQGTCEIADTLIRDYDTRVPDVKWQSITIPVHQKTSQVSLARMIRFAFPEWTIWAIPLMAHEFGDVILAEKGGAISSYAAAEAVKAGVPPSYLDEYLADAFATCAMGPAYAYAALLLGLDPFGAGQPGRTWHESPPPTPPAQAPPARLRAYVILKTLEQIDAEPGKPQKYAEVRQSLKAAWEAALGQVQVTPPPATDPQLDGWVDWLVKQLGSRSLVLYSIQGWDRVQAWKDRLLKQGNEGVEGIKVSATDDLRDVLNAAWVCRAENPRQHLSTIAANAHKLWDRIVDRKERTRAPGTRW